MSSLLSKLINLAGNITGTLAVGNGGTGVTSATGSGSVVLSTSPTLVTPALGTPASGTLANCTGYPIVVPGTSPGLVPSTGLPSNTSGSLPSSGTVGYSKNSGVVTVTAGASNHWTAGTSLSIPAGIWLVTGSVVALSTQATGTYIGIYISSTSTTGSGNAGTTTAVTGATFGVNQTISSMNATGGTGLAIIPAYVIALNSTATYYLGFGSDNTGTSGFDVYLQATCIA